MADLVSLGSAWPNQGFIGIEQEYLDVLRAALTMEAPMPTVDVRPDDIRQVYTDKIVDWCSKSVTFSRKAIVDRSALVATPCFRLMTVSSIMFDPDDHHRVEIVSDNTAWRWQYYPFAFVVAWGLGYHLTNKQLRHAPDSWGRLLRLAKEIYPELTPGTPAWRAFMLALYERFIGMQYDIKEELPHYDRNIFLRENMSVADRMARVSLFRDFVAYCKAATEKELLS